MFIIKKKLRKKIIKKISLLVTIMFVFNMSMAGVFFIAPPVSANGIGSPDAECRGEDFDFGIDKYECAHTSPDEGDGLSTSVVWNDCISVDWTADPDVDGIITKEGSSSYVHLGGASGTINKDGQSEISHITFCGNEEEVPECGDGIQEGDEECDDGNTNDGDGCSANCTDEKIRIEAYKVVCENESYLPNWGLSGTQAGEPSEITATTASDFVDQSSGHCWLEDDWSFQWGFKESNGVKKLAGDHIGPADGSGGTGTDTGTDHNDWKNFDTLTGIAGDPAVVEINDMDGATNLWFRENLQDGYYPFVNPPGDTQNPESAELYCGSDILNFDNYDYLNGVQFGETYYCIALNALIEVEECILELTKTTENEEVNPGDEIIYELTLKNTGTANCTGTGVRIKDYFDEDTVFVSTDTATSSQNSNYIEWNFDILEPQDDYEVELIVEVPDNDELCGTEIVNKAKYWSNQTGNGEYVYATTTIICETQNLCGNGKIEGDEQCDDGNNDNGDGCSSECIVEPLCPTGAKVKFNFSQIENAGSGNMTSDIYVGPNSTLYLEDTWIPLTQNGYMIIDNGIVEDVPGLAIERGPGWVYVMFYGYQEPGNWERAYGTMTFENSKISGFTNEWVDSQGDGIYLDQIGQDEIYWSVGDVSSDFYMKLLDHVDSYFMEYTCELPVCGDGYINQDWEECDDGDDSDPSDGCHACQIEDDCSDIVLARVNITDVQNWGLGDMSNKIYLGTDSSWLPNGSWFPLFWNGSYINDTDISNYEKTPGLTVERLEGSVRAVMYGSTTNADKEHVSGNIEFYNANVIDLRSDNSNDYPENNRLEGDWTDGSGEGNYSAGDDEVWMENLDNNHSYFWLTTTTADDGFYTDWGIIEDCEETCGDGIQQISEECDDGNNQDGDGCNSQCINEYCGDGTTNNVEEECDDENNNNNDECRNDCTLPMVEVPVNTCSGAGEMYFYQGDPFQEIDTYFTVQREQLLIFTKGEITLDIQVDGSPVSLDIVKEISSIKVFSASTSVGSLISVTGSHSRNARGIQGFLAQDPLSPVYSIETLQSIYDGSTTDDIYLLAGTYNYIFFDKYSINKPGEETDYRELDVQIDGPGGILVDETYNQPSPTPIEGAVIGNFTATTTGTYTLGVNTADSIYWPLFSCSEPEFGSISGYKYGDLDNDILTVEYSTNPLAGWIIELYNSLEELIVSTVTDAFGYFEFSNLMPDTYTLEEELQPGWSQLETPDPVQLTSGETSGDNNFINYYLECGNEIIDDGEDCDGEEGCNENCKWSVCEHDVGVRYSYENSKGMGIAIGIDGASEDEDWFNNPIQLIRNSSYDIKYFIDNHIDEPNNIHVVVKNDDDILDEYDKDINIYNSKTINLDTTGFDLGTSTISVTVTKNDGEDCNPEDNYAEREIEIIPICGDGITDENLEEQCDDGNDNNDDSCKNNCTLPSGGPDYGSIKVCKYVDEDGDLETTDDQTPVYNWSFEIDYGTATSSQSTDEGGCTVFVELLAGDYEISEDLGDGWIALDPESASTTVEVSANQQSQIDFINYFDDGPEFGTLEICKYVDIDGNLDTTGDQSPVENWEFILDDGNATTSHYTIPFSEEGDGCTDLIELEVGDYDISETLGDGWVAIEPENGATTTTLIVDENVTVNFYNTKYASITGYKYNDLNNNSEIDDGEKTLSGWEIQLIGCGSYSPLETGSIEFLPISNIDLSPEPLPGACIVMATTTTVDGHYAFTGLKPGDYGVSEVGQSNWSQTFPLDNTFYYFDLEFGKATTSINFLNYYNGPVVEFYCGDGIVKNSEQCDDGNNQDGDGCSSVCTNEGGGGYVRITGTPTPAPIVLGEEGEPVLTIDKSVNLDFVNPGDEIEYIVTVTNTGNLTAFNVVLNDILPEGFTFVDGGNSNKTWSLGDIEPSHNRTTIYKVLVNNEVNNGIYANLAEAIASNHNSVMDTTDIEIREIEVLGVELAPTGFSVKEFALILASILALTSLAVIMRRRIKV